MTDTRDELVEKVREIVESEVEYGLIDDDREGLFICDAPVNDIIALVTAARDAEIREVLTSDAVLEQCGRMGQGITSTEWNNMPAEQRARVREMAGWYIGPLFKMLGLAEEGAER